MFSVEGTHYVFCKTYSTCFLLTYSICFLFSVEGTQYVFCFLLKVLNMFSVEGTHYVFC